MSQIQIKTYNTSSGNNLVFQSTNCNDSLWKTVSGDYRTLIQTAFPELTREKLDRHGSVSIYVLLNKKQGCFLVKHTTTNRETRVGDGTDIIYFIPSDIQININELVDKIENTPFEDQQTMSLLCATQFPTQKAPWHEDAPINGKFAVSYYGNNSLKNLAETIGAYRYDYNWQSYQYIFFVDNKYGNIHNPSTVLDISKSIPVEWVELFAPTNEKCYLKGERAPYNVNRLVPKGCQITVIWEDGPYTSDEMTVNVTSGKELCNHLPIPESRWGKTISINEFEVFSTNRRPIQKFTVSIATQGKATKTLSPERPTIRIGRDDVNKGEYVFCAEGFQEKRVPCKTSRLSVQLEPLQAVYFYPGAKGDLVRVNHKDVERIKGFSMKTKKKLREGGIGIIMKQKIFTPLLIAFIVLSLAIGFSAGFLIKGMDVNSLEKKNKELTSEKEKLNKEIEDIKQKDAEVKAKEAKKKEEEAKKKKEEAEQAQKEAQEAREKATKAATSKGNKPSNTTGKTGQFSTTQSTTPDNQQLKPNSQRQS